MKSKQLLILIGILGVLILGALLVMKREASLRSPEGNLRGQSLFDGFKFNDVERMQVKSLEEEVNLERKNDQWVVTDRNGYPADFGRINGLFLRLLDTKILQSMEAGESRSGQMKLVKPGEGVDEEEAAILISLQDGEGKELRHLLIGKSVYNSGDPANPDIPGGKTSRYLRSSATPELVLEVGNNFDNANAWPFGFDSVNAKPGEWLDKTNFIKVEKIKSVAVSFSDETKTGYTLTRETATADFTLSDPAEGEELDSSKVTALKSILGTASFEDVLTAEEVNEVDFSQGSQVTITTFDGFTYNLTIGPKAAEATTIAVQFKVSAELAEKRVIEEGTEETEEEKALADKTHQDNLTKWKEKLETEKKVEGHTYALSSYRVESLLRPRSEILKGDDPEDEGAVPGVSAVSPPVAVPTAPNEETPEPVVPPGLEDRSQEPRAEAVTPPVEIPPLPIPGAEGAPSADPVPADIPVEPTPTEPEPAPAEPTPSEPEPAPAEPTPAEPEPAPAEPTPAEPEPAPAEPTPSEPEPAPAEPTPAEPEPAPTEPTPAEPEPAPAEPTPTEPEPAPAEPTPAEPEPAPAEDVED